IGKDISGDCIVGNIAKLPHLLIAGTTGSGKSVCMNSLILSLLYKARPDEVKLIMIDPKMVELGIYNGIPHLYVPVVTDPKKAAGALQWSVVEMLKRYRLFSEIGVRDLENYNRHCLTQGEPTMPQVVIVIDELADLMMIASKEVEESICRVAQMGRAAGMHLVIATQRPSADVITGLMKANIPSRIAFAVSSTLESRIILDQGGAEKLIGMGDMLFSPVGVGKPIRIQGAYVSDEEREEIIQFIKENTGESQRNTEIEDFMNKAAEDKNGGDAGGSAKEEKGSSGYDEMLPQAVEVVLETKSCSVSMLQRRVKLGYSRAARIVDQMEELGVVGPYEGAKPRSVIVDREGWDAIRAQYGLGGDDMALAAEMSEGASLDYENA
ncbi:MAG: DNA translocase FtsK, partial [Oscillospiraceae bacterium]|nr:DNA translocase FtsK [Oscillospiraceae bacterium]